jgi:hypothetical protein
VLGRKGSGFILTPLSSPVVIDNALGILGVRIDPDPKAETADEF